MCPHFSVVLVSLGSWAPNARPFRPRKYGMLSWKKSLRCPTLQTAGEMKASAQSSLNHDLYTRHRLYTHHPPWLPQTGLPASSNSRTLFRSHLSPSFFLFTKEAIHFVGHFRLANGQQQLWPELGAKGIAKHKGQGYLGKMQTKRKITHPSIGLFKAGSNYGPLLVVSINLGPLSGRKTK